MNLIDIYNALQKGDITTEEAAQALGFTHTDMKFRITRWGHRLPLLLATLDKIRAGTVGRGEAAKTIGVSLRQMNHLMQTWKVHRPIAKYVVNHTLAEVKWEIRKKYAVDYIAGGVTIEEAAERASVSTRQIRRWVSELLRKHFSMVWKDLKEVPMHRRARLATEIERAEGLEYGKQAVIQAISRGDTTLFDEAANRLAHLTHRRGTAHVRRVPKTVPKPARKHL